MTHIMQAKKSIGVCDAGLGGLTIAAIIQQLLPGEDIIFFGDSERNPYGNESAAQIVRMSREMMDFFTDKDVKAVVIACNTISTLLEEFNDDYPFPIVGIVQPAATYVAGLELDSVGIIATNATINGEAYTRLIQQQRPQTKVYGKGSSWLANLIDNGKATTEEIDAEIKQDMDKLLAMAPINHVVLGCTHYPIVQDNFQKLYPELEFINPARLQVEELIKLLTEKNNLNKQTKGGFLVYTSGLPEVYQAMCERLGCRTPDKIIRQMLGKQIEKKGSRA